MRIRQGPRSNAEQSYLAPCKYAAEERIVSATLSLRSKQKSKTRSEGLFFFRPKRSEIFAFAQLRAEMLENDAREARTFIKLEKI